MQYENINHSDGLSPRDYLLILRRRRAIILQTFFLVSLVGLVVTLRTKPVYQASAQLLVDGQSATMNTVDTGNPLSSLLAPSPVQTVSTQVMVLQTHKLLDQLAKNNIHPADIKVSEVPDTNIIQVDAEAADPKTAAMAPNALLEIYVQQNDSANQRELTTASQFVQTQETKAHQQLVASENALRDFKTSNHITDLTKNRENEVAHVEALKADAQQAQIDLAAARSGLAANRQLLAQEPATLMVKLKATNATVAALQDQIRALEVERDAQVNVPGAYAPGSDFVQGLNAKIAVLKRRLSEQPTLITSETSNINAIRDGLHSKIVDLEARETQLVAQQNIINHDLQDSQHNLRRFADLEVTLARLDRTHDDAVAADKMFLGELNDLSLRMKMQHESARIIEYATVPDSPIRPRKQRDVLLACLVGLFAGICLAILQEALDDRFSSVAEASRLLGLPTLGRVPMLTVDEMKLMPGRSGLNLASESYRSLRANLSFLSINSPVRTLLVTSPNPGEGKSVTAANLALALALDGKKVILVDTDLRRPSLHRRLRLANARGMTDVLLGTAALDDVLLEHAQCPGLMVLPGGSKPPNPSEMLNSRAFDAFLHRLSQMADTVIFDSSPLLAAADAQIIASQVDGVMMVLDIELTKKAAVREAVTMLQQARGNCLGIVYNRVARTDYGYQSYLNYQMGSEPDQDLLDEKDLTVKRRLLRAVHNERRIPSDGSDDVLPGQALFITRQQTPHAEDGHAGPAEETSDVLFPELAVSDDQRVAARPSESAEGSTQEGDTE